MTLTQVGLLPLTMLPLTMLPLFLAGQAQAWTCVPPGGFIVENTLTEEEVLRQRSKGIADVIANALDGDIIVVGRFSRNVPTPFLHEEQLEGIRAQYWPPSENVQMPHQIEYTYLQAYSFEGQKLVDATLVPFSAEAIVARVSISAEYEGIVDVLPTTERDVIGILRSGYGGRALELTTSLCPSYYQIESAQMSDLLECYRDGLCK